MKKKVVENEKDALLNRTLQRLRKLMIETNAGQAMVKFKNSGVIAGWNFAIVVQTPDYDGDDKIDFND